MNRVAIMALGALVVLAGCGKRPVLKPADGRVLPPKALTAASQPDVDQLLAVPTQAKPTRDDELVTKSKPLAPDRFDLPPPG
jgi:multidrug efflux pump subunit AcrA (membrane-fusion protein)